MRITEPFCPRCGYPYPGLVESPVQPRCSDCADRRWSFEKARAACRTEGQVREAILGFKYAEHYFHRRQLIDWLTEAFDAHYHAADWDAVVPVPLYHRKLRERGFNQAAEIAQGLCSKRGLAFSDCLYRYRETISQTTLERSRRWENMAGAFRLKRRFDVTGLRLLIVDDVFTTGATVNACAQALAHAGAVRLAVLTVARS